MATRAMSNLIFSRLTDNTICGPRTKYGAQTIAAANMTSRTVNHGRP